MKPLREKTFFSATDICNFNDCEYLTFVSLNDTPEEERDEQKMLIIEKGMEHEASYLARLASEGAEITRVCHEEKRHPVEDFQETLKCLQAGKPFIAQAMLTHGRLSGIADLLRRVDTPSTLGAFSYEVLDTKLGKKQKASYLLQLCFYGELLEAIQGVFPTYGYIVDGNGEEHRHNLVQCREYFSRLREEFLSVVDSKDPRSISPEPCARCATCSWNEHCDERWSRERHLSLVARINRSQRNRLSAAGITTIDALAAASETPPAGMHAQVYDRLHHQAILQCAKNQPTYRFLHPSSGGIGFCTLPQGDAGDLFYDIEADPLIKAQALDNGKIPLRDGLEYLHGMCLRSKGDTPEFKYFLATTKAEEKLEYEKLIQFFYDRTREYPCAHIYHYSGYEIAALKRLNAQYPAQQELLDILFREERFVDLYAVVRNAVQVSEPKYSIKNLEVFFSKEKRTQDVKGGGDSIVAFEKWLKTKDQSILDDLIEYNRKDCISTIELFEWLHTLKEEASKELGVDWDAERQRRAEVADEEKAEARAERQVERQQQIERYYSYFEIQPLLDTPYKNLLPVEALRLRLFYLADFYRQEAKPLWWEFFALRRDPDKRPMSNETLTHCELVEVLPPESARKRNQTAVYRAHVASMQETSIRVDDEVYDLVNARKLGKVSEIDREQKILKIAFGKSIELPEDAIDITVYPEDRSRLLQPGIDRFLERVMGHPLSAYTVYNGDEATPLSESLPEALPYTALLDIFTKSPPRSKVRGSEDSSVVSVPASHREFPKQLLSAAVNLNNSYLFIQGPPGTGKTYHGSRLVLGLVQMGYRVGITSNSHKAVLNFLEELEAAAHTQGVEFRGAKKGNKDEPAEHYTPRHPDRAGLIQNVFDTKNIDLSQYNVIAGTPYLFVHEKFDTQLDYLLVDEASQLSLANLVAAGISARNLILIGDPQQLPQPLRGQHAAELDKSPLQLLLGEHQVVPPNRGVFLETSRRMHTEICQVLSSHVYDQKLVAPDENRHHRILNPKPRRVTKSSGLLWIPCDHTGNTTSSKEEAALIRELLDELTTCSFQLREGEKKPLTKDDCIVVAPYNLQVKLLQEEIPDVEIGTIDKFQGREAAVAIVSMATSDVQEAPRGVEFLFNTNRLNVALSRAKALAIVVASPELRQTRCRDIAQMGLVNFFCAVTGETGEPANYPNELHA